MHVRPYNKHDFYGISVVEKEAFGIGAYSNLMLREMLNSHSGFTLVLYEENQIHGYATMEPLDISVIDIESICVLPEDQGKGHGSILLGAMEEEGRSRGYSAVVLEVRENNENAIKFYKSHGYEIFQFLVNYYDIIFNGSKNAYRMKKSI
jgi:ribosomal-protein-alanine N-acetyltransferase